MAGDLFHRYPPKSWANFPWLLEVRCGGSPCFPWLLESGDATFGGGGGIYGSGTIYNSSIFGTAFVSNGGGIYGGGTIYNSSIIGVAASGGGIYEGGTIYNSRVSGTAHDDGGGAIYAVVPLTINNSTFTGNQALAGNGGGIYNSSGTVTITKCDLTGNSASQNGGGIYNSSGSLTVTDSTILGNSAPFGADIFLAGGTLTNNNSVIGIIGP